MKKTIIIVMVITIVSKLLGIIRDITLSYFYGASNISDAYLIALTIPTVIFAFISQGIATGYIPLYNKIEEREGFLNANSFTNNLVNVLILISTVIVIFGLLFTDFLVTVFAAGFENETFELAVQLTKISLFAIYFTGIMRIYRSFLNVHGSYTIPSFVGIAFNLVVITSILISFDNNLIIMAIGIVLASFSQLVILIPSLIRKGYRYKFVISLKDKHLKSMLYLALPIIIGVSINEIKVVVDKTMASLIVVGGISALNYANQLRGFIQGVFVVSIITVMYPLISKMANVNNIDGIKKSLSDILIVISLLVVPATIGAMIFSEPIVRLLFGRGAFDDQAVLMTANALFYYSIGMIGLGYREILTKTFFSLYDTKTPMINASIALILNIILNIILSITMGLNGIALATSLSALFTTVLLIISLRKKIGPLGLKRFVRSFLKILSASLLMGLIVNFLYNNLLSNELNPNSALLLAIGIGIIIYIVFIYFLKIREFDSFIFNIKKRLLNK